MCHPTRLCSDQFVCLEYKGSSHSMHYSPFPCARVPAANTQIHNTDVKGSASIRCTTVILMYNCRIDDPTSYLQCCCYRRSPHPQLPGKILRCHPATQQVQRWHHITRGQHQQGPEGSGQDVWIKGYRDATRQGHAEQPTVSLVNCTRCTGCDCLHG